MKRSIKTLCLMLVIGLGMAFAGHADEAKYTISANDESVITFKGYKPLGSQVGGFSDFSGTITLPGDDITAMKVEADIDMVTFYTVERVLIEVLSTEDFFNNAKFPKSTFKSSKIEKIEGDDKYQVTGDLTLIGATKELTFPATIKKTDKGISVTADFKLNRENWGMNKSWKDSAIYDEVDINMELLAEPEKAESK